MSQASVQNDLILEKILKEGFYYVDFKKGEVYSKKMNNRTSWKEQGLLATYKSPSGYYFVSLESDHIDVSSRKNKRPVKSFLRHRIICVAAGWNIVGKDIHHKNGIAGDDRLCNLEVVHHKEHFNTSIHKEDRAWKKQLRETFTHDQQDAFALGVKEISCLTQKYNLIDMEIKKLQQQQRDILFRIKRVF